MNGNGIVSKIINNLIAFGISMPTNIVILILICIIMKCLFKASTKDCGCLILVYLVIGLFLGMCGITMQSFLAIGQWVAGVIKALW